MAMSATAIAFAHVKPVAAWSTGDLDSILITGDSLYGRSGDRFYGPNGSQGQFIETRQLARHVDLLDTRIQFQFEAESPIVQHRFIWFIWCDFRSEPAFPFKRHR